MPWRDAVIERAVALAASVGVGVGNIEGVRTDSWEEAGVGVTGCISDWPGIAVGASIAFVGCRLTSSVCVGWG